ncbi:MAG: hypothetical protein J6Y19_11835 [Kiritimatiellae bacterium]|nr:hypothetical protein [Kiritimatiellia bacterium]
MREERTLSGVAEGSRLQSKAVEGGRGRAAGKVARVLKWAGRAVLAYCVVVTAVRVLAGWSRMHSAADFALYLAGLTFDETIYAPGYSEKAFWEVRSGMSAGEVEELLGKPLWRREGAPGEEVWAYSGVECPEGCVTCRDGFYWKRWVVFDGGGKVLRVEGECWDA